MPIRYASALAAASLLAASLSATAGSGQVEAYLITQSANNVTNSPGCEPGSTATSECVSIFKDMGPGAAVLYTGNVTTLRSTFDAGNGTQVPNFVMNGVAHASAGFGHLHAYSFVQIQGQGGSNVSVGGRSFAQMRDYVTITSSVLPVGTPVTLKAVMDVSGHGGGWMYFGINQFVQQVGVANDFDGVLADYETTFTAKVGDQVRVTYGLVAFTRVFSTAWNAANVLNGRNNTADYGNSAYIYLGGADASQGLTLVSDTGYTYAVPVPEPGVGWLLLAGLPWLAWRARGRMRG